MPAPRGESRLKPVHRQRLPDPIEPPVALEGRRIVERLQGAGHEAYFVGGFVRDWLLGIGHEDVDIATSAHPDEVIALFEKTREVGKSFGVVLVKLDAFWIELATFRSDGKYSDMRRPDEVHYGSLEDDAARRDFTINSIFYDPVTHTIKDLNSGMLDLRRRVLRTVGLPMKRFEEDALRLMRAVRFAVGYELEIEPRTRQAIERKGRNLAKISKERIGQELIRMITGRHAGRAVRLMSDLRLWQYVIPEIEALRGVGKKTKYHPEGDTFEHLAGVMESLPGNPNPALALGALLHDIGKPETVSTDEKGLHFFGHEKVGARIAEHVCLDLRCSNELTARVKELVAHHMNFVQVRQMRPATLKRFLSQPYAEDLLALHKADSLGSDGDLSAYDYCIEHRRDLEAEHGERLRPDPLATGADLIALGLEPGPRFSKILDALHDEQLEGGVTTREEALEFLKARANEPSGGEA